MGTCVSCVPRHLTQLVTSLVWFHEGWWWMKRVVAPVHPGKRNVRLHSGKCVFGERPCLPSVIPTLHKLTAWVATTCKINVTIELGVKTLPPTLSPSRISNITVNRQHIMLSAKSNRISHPHVPLFRDSPKVEIPGNWIGSSDSSTCTWKLFHSFDWWNYRSAEQQSCNKSWEIIWDTSPGWPSTGRYGPYSSPCV